MEELKEVQKEYKKSLRDLKVGVISTSLFIAISCVISYYLGYKRDAQEMKYILGFPDWIFWGVLVPWIAIVVFTIIYGFFFMRGDE